MNDMSQVIVPRSDQINADDLIPGPITITVREVVIRGGQEQPVSIFFEGSDKAFRPCKSMSRLLVAAWGPDANQYRGRSMTLYRDPTVKWAGMEVGGIRISHLSHIDREMVVALTATKGSRKPHRVQPLRIEQRQQQQPEAEQYDIELARADIAFASTLDELAAVWKAKRMAPHRAELQATLDERKAALSQPVADPFETVDA